MQALTELHLSSNEIGDKGAQYLGANLQENTVRQINILFISKSYLSFAYDTDTHYT